MSESKLTTWRWLLAEIGIVVVGILIAFSLNSWWDGRTAAAREQAHLIALRADFRQNVERLDALAASQDRVSRASRALLVVARDQGSVSPDSIDRLMGQVFSSDQFDPVMGAYENLVNSGGLAQIRDEGLRGELASFAAMVEARYAEQFSLALYLDFNRAFMGRLGWADQIVGDGPVGEAGAGTAAPEGGRWNAAVLDDPVFQDHLAFRFISERQVADLYRELAGQARSVLERVESQIR